MDQQVCLLLRPETRKYRTEVPLGRLELGEGPWGHGWDDSRTMRMRTVMGAGFPPANVHGL